MRLHFGLLFFLICYCTYVSCLSADTSDQNTLDFSASAQNDEKTEEINMHTDDVTDTIIQDENIEHDLNNSPKLKDEEKTYFNVSEKAGFNRVSVIIETDVKNPICEGNLELVHTNKTVFLCSDNDDCKACKNFTVTGLAQDTTYNLNITEKTTHKTYCQTIKTGKVEFNVSYTYGGSDVLVKFHTNIPEPVCSGTLQNAATHKVFKSCSDSANCRKCTQWDIQGLKEETDYLLYIYEKKTKSTFNATVNIKVPSMDVNLSVYYTFILVHIDSKHLGSNCTGSLKDIATDTIVFNCSSKKECEECKSFNIENLSPNTHYFFGLYESYDKLKFEKKIVTENLTFGATVDASFKSMAVSIDTNVIKPECYGTLVSGTSVMNLSLCETIPGCLNCSNFTIEELNYSSTYVLIIYERNTGVNLKQITHTKTPSFKATTTVEGKNISTSIKTNVPDAVCTGNITEVRSRKVVFECDKSKKCSSCEDFWFVAPKKFTKYNVTIEFCGFDAAYTHTVKTSKRMLKYIIISMVTLAVIAVVIIGCLIYFKKVRRSKRYQEYDADMLDDSKI